jgi:hypothetical protein
LIEAFLVDVVSARGFAPDDLFFGFELHEANGTVALHGLAVTIVVEFGGLDSAEGRSLVHLTEFLCR